MNLQANVMQDWTSTFNAWADRLLPNVLHATIMLTITCVLAWLLLSKFTLRSPRLRQGVLFCVLLQGLMLVRFPVELPVLSVSNDQSTAEQSLAVGDTTINDAAGLPIEEAVEPSPLNASGETQQATSNQQQPSLASLIGTSDVGGGALISSPWWMGVGTVWLIGFLLIFAISIGRYLVLCHRIRGLAKATPAWIEQWEMVCERLRCVPTPMLVSDSLGPMLVRSTRGYVLVVPGGFWESLSEEQRESVLLHECSHLKRGDVFRQAIVRAIAALHWFNPAAWWAVRHFEESAEWACDELVLRHDRERAIGLASALVQLVEMESLVQPPQAVRGLGVQTMAAPPLRQRIQRLVNRKHSEDPKMHRCCFLLLTVVFLIGSAFQLRLVEAADDSSDQPNELRVVAADVEQELSELESRLDPTDPVTNQLYELLQTDTGRIAFASVLDQLVDRQRDEVRGEAVPNFMKLHFELTKDSQYRLLPSSQNQVQSWTSQAKSIAVADQAIRTRLKSLADLLRDDSVPGQMMKRMLTDDEIGYAIILEAFQGKADPIDLFIAEAMERILVRREEGMVVLPTLPADGREKLEQFVLAEQCFAILQSELDAFAKEFATPDDRHKQLVDMMTSENGKAVIAMSLSDRPGRSAATRIESFFQQMEEISSDTPSGLVIRNDEVWEDVTELINMAKRANKRADQVRGRLTRLAETLDKSDPTTGRFAETLTGTVLSYYIASELPYADFDIAQEIESRLKEVLEESSGGLRVRESSIEEVNERAGELLAVGRRLRRYLRRVGRVIDQLESDELKASLGETGPFVMLVEMQRLAESTTPDPIALAEEELFAEQAGKLVVRGDRRPFVAELKERADELEAELAKDDF
ncbi:MAG: M56 family metallopeptidase [Planctomycetota bacterium]